MLSRSTTSTLTNVHTPALSFVLHDSLLYTWSTVYAGLSWLWRISQRTDCRDGSDGSPEQGPIQKSALCGPTWSSPRRYVNRSIWLLLHQDCRRKFVSSQLCPVPRQQAWPLHFHPTRSGIPIIVPKRESMVYLPLQRPARKRIESANWYNRSHMHVWRRLLVRWFIYLCVLRTINTGCDDR